MKLQLIPPSDDYSSAGNIDYCIHIFWVLGVVDNRFSGVYSLRFGGGRRIFFVYWSLGAGVVIHDFSTHVRTV